MAEKQARSISYQIAAAKLPLAKDLDDFAFKDTPVNEALVRDLPAAASSPTAQRRTRRRNRARFIMLTSPSH